MNNIEQLKQDTNDFNNFICVTRDGLFEKWKNAVIDCLKTYSKSWIKGITFTAFTPSFNDGEPCTYRVNTEDFNVLVDTKEIPEDMVFDYEEFTVKNGKEFGKVENYTDEMYYLKETFSEFFDEMKELMKLADDDAFQSKYPYNTRFIFTTDGLETEEYEAPY